MFVVKHQITKIILISRILPPNTPRTLPKIPPTDVLFRAPRKDFLSLGSMIQNPYPSHLALMYDIDVIIEIVFAI